jgi:chromosomal replication initiation ATPase DnaA
VREGDRTINEVLDVVAKHFALTREQPLWERARVPFRARRVALYLACCVTQRSLPQIGTAFGGVSHTNVLHAKRTVERYMAEDAQFASDMMALKASLIRKR